MRRATAALAILAACSAPSGDVAVTKATTTTKPKPTTTTAAAPTTTTSTTTTTTTEARVPVRAASVGTVPPRPITTPTYQTWLDVAWCESSHRWHLDSKYDGGLQFHPDTWVSAWAVAGGEGPPGYAYQHEPHVQITVADAWWHHIAARSGPAAAWGQWPACSTKLGLR